MTNTIEGNKIVEKGTKFAIVCSRFNDFFVSHLLAGAIDSIVRHGGCKEDIDVAWVPGAYEIPTTAKIMTASKKYDAVIALGLVIDGSTSHSTYINSEVSKGLAQISMEYMTPVVYGVVTTENIEQAIERSGSKAGNRGCSAAETAIEMISLYKKLKA